MKLHNTRKDYKKAIQEGDVCSFSIDDIRLLSCLVGAGGPHDQALGAGALGTIEFAAGRSRWTFEDIGTAVSGEWHDTEAAAVDDLVRVQSMLFPDGLPVEDWFDQTRRQNHLQRVKENAQKVRSHQKVKSRVINGLSNEEAARWLARSTWWNS